MKTRIQVALAGACMLVGVGCHDAVASQLATDYGAASWTITNADSSTFTVYSSIRGETFVLSLSGTQPPDSELPQLVTNVDGDELTLSESSDGQSLILEGSFGMTINPSSSGCNHCQCTNSWPSFCNVEQNGIRCWQDGSDCIMKGCNGGSVPIEGMGSFMAGRSRVD